MSVFRNEQAEAWIRAQCAIRNETIEIERRWVPIAWQSHEARTTAFLLPSVYRTYLVNAGLYEQFGIQFSV